MSVATRRSRSALLWLSAAAVALVANALLVMTLTTLNREPAEAQQPSTAQVRMITLDSSNTDEASSNRVASSAASPIVRSDSPTYNVGPAALADPTLLETQLPDLRASGLKIPLPARTPLALAPMPAQQPQRSDSTAQATADVTAQSRTRRPNGSPLDSTQVDQAPVAEPGNSDPSYPRYLRKRGREGWVSIRYLINTQGQVERIEVLDRSGSEDFVYAVRRHVSRWRFSAARHRGQAVPVWAQHRFEFQLKD